MLPPSLARSCSSKACLLKTVQACRLANDSFFFCLFTQVLRVLQDIFDELCSCSPRFCFGDVVQQTCTHVLCCTYLSAVNLSSSSFFLGQPRSPFFQPRIRTYRPSISACILLSAGDIPPQTFAATTYRTHVPHHAHQMLHLS